MKIKFKYYLHDNTTSNERIELIRSSIEGNVDIGLDNDELNELIGRPFGEVTLQCELDTITGDITIIKASL